MRSAELSSIYDGYKPSIFLFLQDIEFRLEARKSEKHSLKKQFKLAREKKLKSSETSNSDIQCALQDRIIAEIKEKEGTIDLKVKALTAVQSELLGDL